MAFNYSTAHQGSPYQGTQLKVLQPADERVHLLLEPVFHVFAVICHPIYASVDVFQDFFVARNEPRMSLC